MPHHTLESLSISSGIHFPDLHLDFLSGLNCIIGGRGTGKTGVLLFLSFAVGFPFPEEYAEDYDDYIKETLGAGKVTVWVRTQHGVRYKCTRSYGEAPKVYAADGALANVSLDGELFKLEAYGQSSLEGIARNAPAQLALIDKFAEADARRIGDAIERADGRLTQNAAEIRRLTGDIEADEVRAAELPSIAAALQGLELPGGADAQAAMLANERKIMRGRERTAMTGLAAEVTAARTALDAFARTAVARLAASVEADHERGPNADVFRRAHEAIHRAAGAVEMAAEKLRADLSAAEKATLEESHRLAESHAKEDDAYHALVVRLDADRARAGERERLHRRLEELAPLAKRLADRRREREIRKDEQSRLREERAALYLEWFSLRQRVTREITASLRGEIDVTVEHAADNTDYEELLTELLQGANIRPADVTSDIAARIRPADLLALVEHDDPAPLERADQCKTGKPARAQKILAWLRGNDRLHELETVALRDVPRIRLKVGDRFQPSDKVSVGQRVACILPILLLQSAAPLLIDQAEDNLDNAFIYDVLVKSIQSVKTARQLLFVTHNPNVPVLGDAERVFVLATDNGRGKLDAHGTVDDMREQIERLLEGGREAFLRRGKRYGH